MSYNLATRYPKVCRKMEFIISEWDEQMRKNPQGWKSK